MTTVIPLAPHAALPAVRDGVVNLLLEVDAEFVPPLSQRADTLTLRCLPATVEQGLARYLDAVRRESWLVALEGGTVVGLLAFLDDHEDPRLAAWSPSLYASTVAVRPRARRTGLGRQLYDAFESTARQRAVPYLTTRTWTTNSSHLCLLRSRGFHNVAQVPDDREAGVGTVYLACSVGDGAPRSPGLRPHR